ncbi:MAG: ABC transporter permease [Deltaproteobacteria bacterium]|nr:ABC transporter permease [Deltaproteobacteria bacterium]MBW1963024.1 ABC transporter permease [Deltaproteobacteria bacterium]MBW1993241.1 ABC transporter permease [Deltaproteobacteria bacterium]MBW2151243.1 ABC transporter permease [Deltaproteobacteria bacterium]
MRAYIIRRLIQMVITLYVLTSILFFMFRFLPGDPTTMYIDAALPPESQEAILQQFGLDKPLGHQYVIYLLNVIKGEFGTSFYYHAPVSRLLPPRLLSTVLLMGTTILLAFMFGVALGTILAWRRGTRFEVASLVTALSLRSAPQFWTGLMALIVFSYTLKWFPIGGMHTPGQQFTSVFDKYFNLDFLHHLILPAMVAASYYMASPMLIMRNSMLEVMGDDFVEMAKAKGLKERTVIFKHAMRNALLPVVTVLTLMVGFAIGGQVLIETVFRWPGMGREMVLAIQRHDYPMAQASFFMLGVLVITLNFVTDLLYGYLDPRVTYR